MSEPTSSDGSSRIDPPPPSDGAAHPESQPTVTYPSRAPEATRPVSTPATKPETGKSNRPLPDIAGYELFGELGHGGMGIVYKARHLALDRVVALKMIRARHATAEDLARFHIEADAAARLQHPNVVQIYEFGDCGGQPFLALEFCGGGSLASKLNGTPLPPAEAARLVETLARAIQAAHEQGIVHRDLTPGNVLLAGAGGEWRAAQVKISDFGLAKRLGSAAVQTASGAVLGT